VDQNNHKIRKITKQGFVSTIAGSTFGFLDGIGTNAKFSSPVGIALDSNKNIFVTDFGNHKIRKITPQGNRTAGYMDGDANSSQFYNPWGITFAKDGNLYVADANNHRVRKLTPQGNSSTIAGSSAGYGDGIGSHAKFNCPIAITIDDVGNLLVADYNNHRIRKVTPQGAVSTIAGSSAGNQDGECSKALFNYPVGITLDWEGNIIVADHNNHTIRKITLIKSSFKD